MKNQSPCSVPIYSYVQMYTEQILKHKKIWSSKYLYVYMSQLFQDNPDKIVPLPITKIISLKSIKY